MEFEEMLNIAESLSASDYYVIGFVYKHLVYAYNAEKLNPKWITFEKASRGQGMSLRLRIRVMIKQELINMGARCVGVENDLDDDKYNKGEMFEKMITEANGNHWSKDHIGFWVSGDTRINNKEVQIKFDGATITNTATVKNILAKVA